jgi:hypothetical protein
MACTYGHLLTLREHSIEADGMVSPSVLCPEPDCTFHAYVRLEGWNGGSVRASG